MKEIVITTNKLNHLIDPVLSAWGWEVPLDLFLGGLTGGILVVSGIIILLRKEEQYPAAANRLFLWAPIFLALGLLALFLDLEHTLYFWRFYTTFQITSPMSWGSWIIFFVFPVCILLALGTLRQGYPAFFRFVESLMPGFLKGLFHGVVNFSERNLRVLGALGVPGGILLATYTGLLLCTVGARPFWNTSVMAPLFLNSGICTGLAFGMLLARESRERTLYSRLLIGLITLQLILLGVMLLTMVSSGSVKQEAAQLVLGGELTRNFWICVILIGTVIPIVMEVLQAMGYSLRRLSLLTPVCVLLGGYMFRDVAVRAGQLTGWIPY